MKLLRIVDRHPLASALVIASALLFCSLFLRALLFHTP